ADSAVARPRPPKVHSALHRVAVDLSELGIAELQVLQRAESVVQLGHAGGSYQRGGHSWVAQYPGDRHLRQRLSAIGGDLIQLPDAGEVFLAQVLRTQRSALGSPGVLRHAVEILAGEQALGE